jgi:hypothetical protein
MPGPPAKHDSVRARRNRTSTAKTLAKPIRAALPPLPARAEVGPWHELTTAWWEDLRHSPMAPEYDDSDVHGLVLLAALVDRFWCAPSKELAGEIRLQRREYGLSPMARRTLQWSIEHFDGEAPAGPAPRGRKQASRPGKDPRTVLRAV